MLKYTTYTNVKHDKHPILFDFVLFFLFHIHCALCGRQHVATLITYANVLMYQLNTHYYQLYVHFNPLNVVKSVNAIHTVAKCKLKKCRKTGLKMFLYKKSLT